MSRHWAERIGWVVLVGCLLNQQNAASSQHRNESNREIVRYNELEKAYNELKQSYAALYKGSEKEAEDLRHANWKPLKTPRAD